MKTCCSSKLLNQCKIFMEGEFFKAFIDKSRQKIILTLLENGEMTVNDVVQKVKINQSNVSRHLTLLERAGVAISNRRGRENYYKPNYQNIAHRLQSLANIVDQCCPQEEKGE